MDYKKLFDEWAASKPDEQISYATAFQLLDFVEWLNKNASQQCVETDVAYWLCKNCGAAQYKDFDTCGDCNTPRGSR